MHARVLRRLNWNLRRRKSPCVNQPIPRDAGSMGKADGYIGNMNWRELEETNPIPRSCRLHVGSADGFGFQAIQQRCFGGGQAGTWVSPNLELSRRPSIALVLEGELGD